MKIIAFFNLKDKKRIDSFLDWTKRRQKVVFEREISGLENFKVFKIIDDDNCENAADIVQVLDWSGTADDWRKTLASFRDTQNAEVNKICNEWLDYCDEESTKIIYAI